MTFFLRDGDTVALAQYFSRFGTAPLGPQERLMLAVLEDAIECFQQYTCALDGKHERLFLQAEEWILDRDSDWPFSFENICETLHLEPNYIRRGLLKKQQLLSVAPNGTSHFKCRTRINRTSTIKTPHPAPRAENRK